MKKLKIIIVSSLILILSCNDKNADTSSKERNLIDSVSVENIKDKVEVKAYASTKSLKSCNETFEMFFEKFAKDSIFQKNRIRYPLKFLYNDYEIDSVIVINKYDNKDEYKYFDFSKDKYAMERKSDKYTVEIEKSDGIVKYLHLGYDNGIMNTFTFKIINGCWYMVEIFDEST